MGSSECERVANLSPDSDTSSAKTNLTSKMHPNRSSSNSYKYVYIFLLCLILCLSISTVDSASIVKRRANSEEKPERESNNDCKAATPCGWAVYIPDTRRVDYYMRNKCECPKGLECLKMEDDLSTYSYVYRCGMRKPKPTTPPSSTS